MAAYLADNRVAEAESILNEALKKNEKDFDALLQRGQVSVPEWGRYRSRYESTQ